MCYFIYIARNDEIGSDDVDNELPAIKSGSQGEFGKCNVNVIWI